jgi:flagellum-specific peptidoglycan hydrolase FlgJ
MPAMRIVSALAALLLTQGCLFTQETARADHPPMPEMPAHWTTEVVDGIADSWPDDHRKPFLSTMAPLAMRSAVQHCVPPSVTVAQAVLESGWGQSDKATELNNLFGIKAADTEPGAVTPTWEVIQGQRVLTQERFRKFESWSEAVRLHDRRLAEHPAYEGALEVRESWEAYIEAIAPVYATDPNYAERIRTLVQTYGLDALDGPALERAAAKGHCS